MTASKVFLKIVRKNLWMIIMYTVILCVCSIMNMKTSTNVTDYSADKPSIVLFNNDDSEFSNALTKYLEDRTIIKDIKDEGSNIKDALYYTEVFLVVDIDEGFGEDLAAGKKPATNVRSTNSMGSALAEMILDRYVKVAQSFAPAPQEEIIEKTNEFIKYETPVEISTNLDTGSMQNLASYFNFLNYALLAGLVFAISFATLGFKRTMVKKRLAVSATDSKKINHEILACNFALAIILWLIYLVIGYFMVGDSLFSVNGILMIINSAFFMAFSMVFAFLLANITSSTNVLLPIVNVVSIGTSFFCGVFLPAKWMPDFVNNIAHIFPSFYYIDNNYRIADLESINMENLIPLLINAGIVLASTIILIIINNTLSRRQNQA